MRPLQGSAHPHNPLPVSLVLFLHLETLMNTLKSAPFTHTADICETATQCVPSSVLGAWGPRGQSPKVTMEQGAKGE